MSTTTRGGFSVRGVRFATPAAAREAASRLRSDAEEHASELRSRGRDVEAERIFDRANDQANAYETAAAERDTGAGQTPRTKSAAAPASRQPAAARPRTSSPARSRGRSSTGGRAAWRSAKRYTPAGQWGDLVMTVAWATVGLALLTLVIGTKNGPRGFSWLVGGFAKFAQMIAGPGDPLAGIGNLPAAGSSSSSSGAGSSSNGAIHSTVRHAVGAGSAGPHKH